MSNRTYPRVIYSQTTSDRLNKYHKRCKRCGLLFQKQPSVRFFARRLNTTGFAATTPRITITSNVTRDERIEP